MESFDRYNVYRLISQRFVARRTILWQACCMRVLAAWTDPVIRRDAFYLIEKLRIANAGDGRLTYRRTERAKWRAEIRFDVQ